MGDCICSSCRNLTGVIGENGEIEEYRCEYGFPSENCSDCTGDDCSESCRHYLADAEVNTTKIVKCKGCGKELEKVFDGEDEEGDVFCIECYLKDLDK